MFNRIKSSRPGDMLYRPLDVDGDEIRLISLSRREENVDVSVTLEYASLINPPSYTTLSYCWGDPAVMRTISINDHKVQVTWNLDAALRQLQNNG